MLLGDGLECIGNNCFGQCGLEEIVIPRSVLRIEYSAFCGCQRLSRLSFEVRSRLEHVGYAAFRGTRLTPKGVKYP